MVVLVLTCVLLILRCLSTVLVSLGPLLKPAGVDLAGSRCWPERTAGTGTTCRRETRDVAVSSGVYPADGAAVKVGKVAPLLVEEFDLSVVGVPAGKYFYLELEECCEFDSVSVDIFVGIDYEIVVCGNKVSGSESV